MRRFVVSWAVLLLAAPAVAAARPRGDVAALQVALRAVGTYAGTVDGLAGPSTRAAVARFQARRGLAADGVPGHRTRRALGRRGRPAWGSRTIVAGARGWDVAALQFLLARRGFPSGPIDGGFGARTRRALLRYQRWAGLPADGVAGPAVRASLRGAPPRVPVRLVWPVAAGVSDRFGPRGVRWHGGLDFPAAAGVPVRAMGSGTVVTAAAVAGGHGRLVVLAHGGGLTTWYAHLSRIEVRPGQVVAAGAQVGRVGATGTATGPHLHVEARVRGALADPLPALR